MISIKENYELMKNEFIRIKKMGLIELENDTVGSKFEKIIGIKDNQLMYPDFFGIEIKTHNEFDKHQITLFNLTPENKINELFEKYSYEPKNNSKRLYGDFTTISKGNIGIKYHGILKISNKKLHMLIYDIYNNLIDDSTYWLLDKIVERFEQKCNNLCFIKCQKFKINNKYYVKYQDMTLYSIKNKNTIIDLIKEGIITINIKVDLYKTGPKKGMPHDHGTSFRLNSNNLDKLFDIIYIK